MTALPDLEDRLRTGLHAAADALPPADTDGRSPAGPSAGPTGDHGLVPLAGPGPHHRGHRRRTAVAAAGVAAAATLVAGAALALTGGGDDGAEVRSAPATEPDATTSTTASGTPAFTPVQGPAVDPPAGTAVATGGELATFGPDGQRDGSLPLAPLTGVQAVTSDRHGAWIACGTPPTTGEGTAGVDPGQAGTDDTFVVPDVDASAAEAREGELRLQIQAQAVEQARDGAAADATPAVPTSNVYRYRADQDPEPLGFHVLCVAGGLGVTEVQGHDSLVYASPVDFTVRRFDLVTGEHTSLGIDAAGLSGGASIGGGRLASLGPDGLALRDLASGQAVPVPPIDLPVRPPEATSGAMTSDIALSPAGDSLAVIMGDPSSMEVVVFDLATGAERLRRPVSTHGEGSEIAYDGTTVAVGTYYEGAGPVQVFDVATGDERTIDTYGVLP